MLLQFAADAEWPHTDPATPHLRGVLVTLINCSNITGR
jgi:hypothetical protein